MHTAPRSKAFDDVYFSRENGLGETRHVFIGGNNLPAAWAKKPRFTIAETGFGTGLNFLATSALFQRDAGRGQILEYISFEKYPLSKEDIAHHLVPWREDIGDGLDRLCSAYPALLPGFHRVIFSRNIILTLVFDDVNAALPQISGVVDCWFLDGFKPATNPEMWTNTVFENMARLSRPGSTFATFTAAGDVRRGLQAAGFSVDKVKGFGSKRDMLTGCYKGAP